MGELTITEILRSKLVRFGLALLVIGSGPLLLIGAAAALGLTEDPNPNPVAFGIMAMFSFWPGLLMIGGGALRARRGPQ